MSSRFRVLKGLFGQLNKAGDAFAAFRKNTAESFWDKVIKGIDSVIPGFSDTNKRIYHQKHQRHLMDKEARQIHLRRDEAEFRAGAEQRENLNQELQDFIDTDIDNITDRGRRIGALSVLTGWPYSEKHLTARGITPEYISKIKQELARNVRKTGKMFPDEYAKRINFNPKDVEEYTKDITENISKQRWQRRVKMSVSSEDLLERAKKSRGDEIPSR